MHLYLWVLQICVFAARVRSTTGGYVFTGVCMLTGGGVVSPVTPAVDGRDTLRTQLKLDEGKQFSAISLTITISHYYLEIQLIFYLLSNVSNSTQKSKHLFAFSSKLVPV